MNRWSKRTVRVVRRIATSGRSTDPVVINRLIGIQDNRDTLSSVNIDVLHFNGVVLNTIGFYEGDVVIVDREGKEGTTSGSKDTEAVSLAFLDVDYGERD